MKINSYIIEKMLFKSPNFYLKLITGSVPDYNFKKASFTYMTNFKTCSLLSYIFLNKSLFYLSRVFFVTITIMCISATTTIFTIF